MAGMDKRFARVGGFSATYFTYKN